MTDGHPTRFRHAVFVAAFAALVCLNAYRTAIDLDVPGRVDPARWESLSDFRDNAYYPVVAFLDGKNPYDAVQYASYPVSNTNFPWYSPLTLLVHLPFGLLPYRVAEGVYYAFSIVLIPILSLLVLRWCGSDAGLDEVFGLAAAIMLSRPGQMTLRTGQPTALLVIATCVALHLARSRPGIAGIALAITTLKPTFGAPLGFLMLVRGDRRAVVTGAVLAAALTLPVAFVLVQRAGGPSPFAAMLMENYRVWFTIPVSNPVTSVMRVDAVSFVSRLAGHPLGMAWEATVVTTVLLLATIALRPSATGRAVSPTLSGSLVCLAVVLCTYHQVYDLLLLALPVGALAVRRSWATGTSRWLLLALLLLPSFNYLSSFPAQGLGVTGEFLAVLLSLNSSALLGALALSVWLALRPARESVVLAEAPFEPAA